MRAFVILASLAVLAAADVKHLYDAPYRHQLSNGYSSGSGSGSGSGSVAVNFVSSGGNTHSNYVQPSVQYGTPSSSGFVQQTANLIQQQEPTQYQVNENRFGTESVGAYPNYDGFGSGSSSSSGSFGASSIGGFAGSGSGSYSGNGNAYETVNYGGQRVTFVKQTAPLITKSSYVFAAPEDKEDIQREQTIVLPRPRQHYNVLFIKAPATTIVNTPSAALAGQTQEKTLIYVLSDKKRIENRLEVPEVDQVKPQKPEVFFIKYNKPTEVVNGKIRYETVDAVNGAENGAVNGVPNKVSAQSGALLDESTNANQAQIAQAIYKAVQTGGLQGGIQTVDQLISTGHSISNYGGDSFQSQQVQQGQYDAVQNNHNSQQTAYKPVSVIHGSGSGSSHSAKYAEKGYSY